MNFRLGNSFDIAVIGAGASGTLVAAQFHRLTPADARMVLIGSQARPARGMAYDTQYPSHLLNVPAGNMSAFPDDKDHFTRWLAKHLPGSNAWTFAPRKLYGDYLLNIFTKTLRYSNKVDYLNQKAVNLTRQDGLWTIQLENDNVLEARSVVLALGNHLLPADPIDFHSVGSYYYRNPGCAEITSNLPSDAPVLLIGTGLTMVDVLLALRETGHRGPIHAISRHGRLPQTHQTYEPYPLSTLPEEFRSPSEALGWLRVKVEITKYMGIDWRAVIDSLRPHTAAIWQNWSQKQRESFLRHARNLWDIHRHRMAPEVADQLNVLLEEGTLNVHRGSLVYAQPDGDEVMITWNDGDTGEIETLKVKRVINCSGPSRDITINSSPLISQLLFTGWISPDPLKLGLDTDEEGRLLDIYGNISPGLFSLGPLCIPRLWESIAIPEIRNQAIALVNLLLKESQTTRLSLSEHAHQLA
jgi:uncharacterized NAD(P)/FAD-binding protein YdhS